MKTHVTRDIFIDTFLNSHDYNKFSMSALNALFEYYEMLEDDCGEEMSFDYIAIACEWSENHSATAYMLDHYNDLSDLDIDWLDADEAEDNELIESKALEYLQERTQVIEFAQGKVLVMQY